MSVQKSTGGSYSPRRLPEGVSLHHEPPEQGGAKYWKCECGAESIFFDDVDSAFVHRVGCSIVGGL